MASRRVTGPRGEGEPVGVRCVLDPSRDGRHAIGSTDVDSARKLR